MACFVGLDVSQKLTAVCVVDEAGRPIGLLDITDVIGLVPEADKLPLAA